jgi:hypothetical protein
MPVWGERGAPQGDHRSRGMIDFVADAIKTADPLHEVPPQQEDAFLP